MLWTHHTTSVWPLLQYSQFSQTHNNLESFLRTPSLCVILPFKRCKYQIKYKKMGNLDDNKEKNASSSCVSVSFTHNITPVFSVVSPTLDSSTG